MFCCFVDSLALKSPYGERSIKYVCMYVCVMCGKEICPEIACKSEFMINLTEFPQTLGKKEVHVVANQLQTRNCGNQQILVKFAIFDVAYITGHKSRKNMCKIVTHKLVSILRTYYGVTMTCHNIII